jgi:hypothetical protein
LAFLEFLRAPPLVPGVHPMFGFARARAPGAPPLMTGSLLRALVTQNRWLLARPAARATGLAPLAGFRWFRAGCSRSFFPFLSALVTRTGWFWLARHFRAGLAPPAGLRWFCAGRSRSFL